MPDYDGSLKKKKVKKKSTEEIKQVFMDIVKSQNERIKLLNDPRFNKPPKKRR